MKTRFRIILPVLLTLIVAVVLNVIVSVLPESITKPDMTDNGLYSFSDQTKTTLEELDSNISVYFVSAAGKEDSVIQMILEKYKDASSKISVKWIDPAAYPDFVKQYYDGDLADNSLIVTCGNQFQVIQNTSLYVMDYELYFSDNEVKYNYAVESELTYAIRTLTKSQSRTIVCTTGHGEDSVTVAMKTAIEKQGFKFETKNLVSENLSVSEMDCLLILGPDKDFTDEEANKIREYLNDGGRLFYNADYIKGGRPNIDSIMSEFGITAIEGVVFEGSSANYVSGYPYYLVPFIVKHGITRPLKSAKSTVLVPIAQPLVVTSDVEKGIVAESLLDTTASSYIKDPYTMKTMEKEAGDQEGSYSLGVASANNNTRARVVWYSSVVMWEDDVNRQSSGGNEDLIINSLGWLCEDDSIITIHSKSNTDVKMIIPEGSVKLLSILFVAIVPVIIVAVGGIVIYKRKNSKNI